MSKLAHDWDKYATTEDHSEDICENCKFHLEEYSWPSRSKGPVKIRHLCSLHSTFDTPIEIDPKENCRFFAPRNTQPPKDDKLEVVYHDRIFVLSDTPNGIRIEIKEKNDEQT